jgi:4-hydroxybenzoate polyprenyltransferase
MARYLKVYILGTLSVWMLLYGGVIMTTENWPTGLLLLLLAVLLLIEVITTAQTFDEQ